MRMIILSSASKVAAARLREKANAAINGNDGRVILTHTDSMDLTIYPEEFYFTQPKPKQDVKPLQRPAFRRSGRRQTLGR